MISGFDILFERLANREQMGEVMFRLTDGGWWTTDELCRITHESNRTLYQRLATLRKHGVLESKLVKQRGPIHPTKMGWGYQTSWRLKP
jgi:hypothetical protein